MAWTRTSYLLRPVSPVMVYWQAVSEEQALSLGSIFVCRLGDQFSFLVLFRHWIM